jgi:metal-responsive CopG/Arc/MetJ family transcriptional regulator
MIATEIHLPEPLFRRFQALLDRHPTQSIDALFAQAIEAYLAHLNWEQSVSIDGAIAPNTLLKETCNDVPLPSRSTP